MLIFPQFYFLHKTFWILTIAILILGKNKMIQITLLQTHLNVTSVIFSWLYHPSLIILLCYTSSHLHTHFKHLLIMWHSRELVYTQTFLSRLKRCGFRLNPAGVLRRIRHHKHISQCLLLYKPKHSYAIYVICVCVVDWQNVSMKELCAACVFDSLWSFSLFLECTVSDFG